MSKPSREWYDKQLGLAKYDHEAANKFLDSILDDDMCDQRLISRARINLSIARDHRAQLASAFITDYFDVTINEMANL